MKRYITQSANISINADFDAEAFKRRHKEAQQRSAEKREDRIANLAYQIKEADSPIETAFELLVPGSGKADTVAGELVRAMMRILYRDYNDGDVFYEGYGIETCADAVAFLCDKLSDIAIEDKFEDIAWRTLKDDAYTRMLQAISNEVIDYILNNPELLIKKNTEDMFDYNGEQFIKEREWEPSYDYDCDLPDSVIAHIEKGNISTSDIEWELEDCDNLRDAERIDVSDNYVSIYGLKIDDYEMLEEHLYDWLEDYGQQLNDEYGNPEEDQEDEEEY